MRASDQPLNADEDHDLLRAHFIRACFEFAIAYFETEWVDTELRLIDTSRARRTAERLGRGGGMR